MRLAIVENDAMKLVFRSLFGYKLPRVSNKRFPDLSTEYVNRVIVNFLQQYGA